MSKSFTFRIISLIKFIPKRYPNLSIVLTTTASVSHLLYAYCTKDSKIINVKQKYKFDRHGFTEFIIIDDNNNHYNVNNSIWYNKWNSIEDWNKIETNKNIQITYYGWRIPVLGLFPNVIRYYD